MRAALASCVLLATSCLELEQTVTLRADGSGTQQMTLGMTERALTTAKRHAAAMQQAGIADPAKVFDAALVRREVTAAGLRCDEVKTWAERQRRFVRVEASFADLDDLRASPLNGSGAEWVFRRGPQPGTAVVELYPKGREAWRAARAQAKEIGPEPSAEHRRWFERAKRQIDGLSVTWVLEVPGDLVSCSDNLRKTGPRQVTARITAAAIETPADLVQQLAPRFQVVFDARDCKLPLRAPERGE